MSLEEKNLPWLYDTRQRFQHVTLRTPVAIYIRYDNYNTCIVEKMKQNKFVSLVYCILLVVDVALYVRCIFNVTLTLTLIATLIVTLTTFIPHLFNDTP